MPSSSSPIQLHRPVIKVNGTAQAALVDKLVEVVVDTAVFLPGMFSLLINDSKMEYMDSSPLSLGAPVDICVEVDERGTASTPLISGIVTGIEADMSAEGACLFRVRGYDKSIKLTQGRRTATYLKMKDSDIVSKLAGLNGLSADTSATSATWEHVIQYNQSDWDFIVDRAKRNGFLLSSDGSKISFSKPSSLSPVATLDRGTDLLSFRPRLSVLGQVQDAKTESYDPVAKAAVSGSKTSSAASSFQSTSNGSGGAKLKSALSLEAHDPRVDMPLTAAASATTASEARVMQRESRFVQAEGVCLGNPSIRAGKAVTITGAGKLFSANYYITQARHVITRGSYQVEFSASGSQPETLQSLLLPEQPAAAQSQNVVVALVTNDKDPQNLGRVKVKYPWLKDANSTEVESDWAQVVIPGGVKNRMIGFVPGVNDEVLVLFVQGDINSPVVIGALWNKVDAAPANMTADSHLVQQRVIQSASGHTITLSDKANDEQISIQSKSGHLITLSDKSGSEKVTIKDKTGSNSIVIDAASKAIQLTSSGKLEISATGDLVLDSKGNIKITSTGNINLSGGAGMGKLDLQSSGTALQGMKVDITAQTTAAVKGSAMVEVQGALVKIN